MLDLDQWRKDAAEAPDDDSWESRQAWRVRRLVAEVERLTRERDLRPTITAEDAARCAWNVCGDEPEDGDAAERIDAALHAHATRARNASCGR